MRKIIAVLGVVGALTAEAAPPTVVISVPAQTSSSLPVTVQTPTGPVIIIPDYRAGGTTAVVTPGAK